VIFGASFLGCESASTIRRANPDAKITVVHLDDPFVRVFGPDIAK